MRRPQPKNREGSPAGPPGKQSSRRSLPRLRSRKARFGALGVLAVGVTGGLLAASAIGAGTPAPPQTSLKVLLIGNGTADPTTGAWEAALTSEGVPYTEVSASNTATLGSWNVALPALTTGTTGNYNGVVIADNPAEFATGQLSNLYAYEAQYNVRQLDGSVSGFPSVPPNLGVANDTAGLPVTATSEALTAAGTTALPGLAGSIPFDTGSYAYPATVSSPAFTSWLSYGGATSLGGVYQHTSTDAQKNVQEAALFFSYNQNQTQWHVLSRGLIDWVTNNTHLGLFRNYASLTLDDMFNSDNTWDIPSLTTSLTASAQVTAADVVAAAQWSRLNNFRIDWAYNAGVSSSNAIPATPDALLAQYQATDPATGKPYAADFGWINHTWDHATLDQGCATQNYIEAEINQNAAFATQAPTTAGLGGLGLTPDPNGTSNGYGTFNIHSFVPGEHAGLANLIPGATASIDAVSTTAAAGGSGGTLPVGTYNYAVTAQYIANTGDSQTQTSSVVVGANQTVALNWTGVCKAASYRVYRENPGATTWNYITTVSPPAQPTLNPTSTTNTSGGGMAPVSYTDTGAAGTATTFVPSLTATTALEFPYEQNQSFNAAITATSITSIGGDASKPYPNPPTTAFGINTTTPYTGGTFPAGQSFTDGTAQVVPRHPINVYYNVATWPQETSEYNAIYPGTGSTQASITNQVVSGMFGSITSNDPAPFYAHQTNLVGAGTPTGSVLLPVLDSLESQYHSVFSAAEPYVQPTLAQSALTAQRQQAWAAAVAAGAVTATEQGGTIVIKNTGAQLDIPINAPTGTLVEPGGTAFGSAYAGSRSDWITVPAGGSYTIQAPAAPYVTTQPANVSGAHAGDNVSFTAAATNGQSNPAATVQWDVSTNNGLTFAPIPGATSTTLALNAVTGAMNGNQYEAIFTNTLGSATSNAATLGVGHTVPTVQSGPSAGAITFGTPLSGVPLSGGNVTVGSTTIPGTWTFVTPPGSTVLPAGLQPETATFIPTDTGSYTSVTAPVQVEVDKATPSVFILPGHLTYGQTLANTPLLATARSRNGAVLAGGVTVIQNAKFKPNAGAVAETVSYIPADSADYNAVTETITVLVNKAHPKLTAVVATRKPAGGKAMSVLLTGLQPGAKEQLVVQNSRGKTQTVFKFTARGSSQTISIKLTGAHHRRIAKGNYRVVIVQGATSNTYAGSSAARKFKIVK
jgi:hypothetical protein